MTLLKSPRTCRKKAGCRSFWKVSAPWKRTPERRARWHFPARSVYAGHTGGCLPHSCIKKMAKRLKNHVGIELTTYRRYLPGVNQRWTWGSGLLYAIFFTLRESRRTPNPALASVRSKVLRLHTCRLDFGALRLLQQWGLLWYLISDALALQLW